MASNNRPTIKYVYDLPYFERRELCRILDHNDKWEELGGKYMNFDVMTIQYLRQLIMRGKSPTDDLLTLWGQQNHTVLELFVLLSRMQHYQSMMTLKPFVDPQYHRLIYEGEENLTRIFRNPSVSPVSQSHSGSPSINKPCNLNVSHDAPQLPAMLATGGSPQNPIQSLPDKSMEVGRHNLNMPEPSFPQNQGKINLTDKASPAVDKEGKILNTPRPPLAGIPTSNEENANVPSVSPVMGNPSAVQGPPEEKENNVPSSDSQKKSIRTDVADASSVAEGHSSVRHISYKELLVATNGWDKGTILGKGGFGTVFKGNWKNTLVAIKRIELRGGESASNHQAQLQQSLREMKYLNEYRHDNILPLYGYSLDGEEPCLLYQFIPNGSLEDRLLCRNGTPPLSWVQRQNIARGTARGLQFLHTIGDKPLIHGDIKSANILLDQNFEARIGDFGLAREGPNNQYTHIKVSKVHGTRPYLPDEFLRSKQISTKVDTYSFGIVLFELATGLRAYDDARLKKFLKDHVELCEEEGSEVMLIDRRASLDGMSSAEWMGIDCAAGCPSPELSPGNCIFNDLLQLGKWCVKRKPADRPEMVLVLRELEAMTARREMANRAQSLLRNNNLTPTNPYEQQLLHDQWHRVSPQPMPMSLQKVYVGTRLSPNPGGSLIPQQSPPASGSSTSSTVPSPIMMFHNNQPRFPNNPIDPAYKHLHWPSPVMAPIALLPPRIPSLQVQPPSPVPPEDSLQLQHQGAHNGYDGGSRSPTPGNQSSMSVPYSEEFLPATIPGQGDYSSTQALESKAGTSNAQADEGTCSGAVDPSQLLPILTELGIGKGKESNSDSSSTTVPNSQLSQHITTERNLSQSQKIISAQGKSDTIFGEY